MKCIIDRAMWRDGKVVGWAEIKDRHTTSTYYPTFMMTLAKWKEGGDYFRITQIPFLIIVRFTDDVIMWTNYSDINVMDDITFGVSGRTDRNDPNDISPMVYIPMTYFKLL